MKRLLPVLDVILSRGFPRGCELIAECIEIADQAYYFKVSGVRRHWDACTAKGFNQMNLSGMWKVYDNIYKDF